VKLSLAVTVATIVPAREIVRVSFSSTTAFLAIKLILNLLLTTTLCFLFGFGGCIW
jgi:hypothetical protein